MNRKTKPKATPRRNHNASRNQLLPDVLDPDLQKEITRLVRGFVIRTLLMFLLLAVVTEIFVQVRHLPNSALPMVFSMAAFGIVIPFVRGADRIFKNILNIGKQRLDRRRFRDAAYVLEYFHRFGNMSFDLDGEAHYQLIRAEIGLGNLDRAQDLMTWLARYRKRSEWPAKAQTMLDAAERARTNTDTNASLPDVAPISPSPSAARSAQNGMAKRRNTPK